MALKKPQTSKEAFARVKEIIEQGTFQILPEFQGSGAPGDMLEYLCKVERNNFDSPDLKDWEIKFHGGNALLTLLHKDPQPTGILNRVVDTYGWDNGKGQISFRHTIKKKSARGFVVYNTNNQITVAHESDETIAPYWEHDTILEAMGAKLRRLILVHGKVNKATRQVTYKSAIAYWGLNLMGFCKAIEDGLIRIDFDCRTTNGRGTSLRNHGTKLRIKINDVGMIYKNHQVIV
jgi:hypothetical protein